MGTHLYLHGQDLPASGYTIISHIHMWYLFINKDYEPYYGKGGPGSENNRHDIISGFVTLCLPYQTKMYEGWFESCKVISVNQTS